VAIRQHHDVGGEHPARAAERTVHGRRDPLGLGRDDVVGMSFDGCGAVNLALIDPACGFGRILPEMVSATLPVVSDVVCNRILSVRSLLPDVGAEL
jgi:hypothetical protein